MHEAVLQPIATFVYTVIATQQQAVVGRQKSEISTRRRRLRMSNPADGRRSVT